MFQNLNRLSESVSIQEHDIVFGVETSCDETALAVLRGDELLANRVSSQVAAHRPYGGVVPEIASRNHVAALPILFEETIRQAGIAPGDIGLVAATRGPGLASSLLTGFTFAKALAVGLRKPFVGVNHIEAHLLSPFFGSRSVDPCVGLVASGGHTLLVDAAGLGEYRLLEGTRDDAAGEAFDKAAKLAGLPYPGGPEIDSLAKRGDPKRYNLPRSMLHEVGMSFSGLKTAVRYLMPKIDPGDVPDLCASFQEAVVDVLVRKSLHALERTRRGTLAASGGVACNSRLRERLSEESRRHGFALCLAEPWLTTDNAVMIAHAAQRHAERGFPCGKAGLESDIDPNLKLVLTGETGR